MGSYSDQPLLLNGTVGTTAPSKAQFSPPGAGVESWHRAIWAGGGEKAGHPGTNSSSAIADHSWFRSGLH